MGFLRLTCGGREIPFEESFHLQPHPEPYSVGICPPAYAASETIANWENRAVRTEDVTSLPNSTENGFAQQRLIVAPNRAGLIADLIDGVISGLGPAAR